MAKRSTLSISVTPAQSRFIAARVKSGRYQSASEVIREGIRMLQEDEQRKKAVLDDFRRKIAEAEASVDRGELVTPEQFRASLAARRVSRAQRKRAS